MTDRLKQLQIALSERILVIDGAMGTMVQMSTWSLPCHIRQSPAHYPCIWISEFISDTIIMPEPFYDNLLLRKCCLDGYATSGKTGLPDGS